MASIAKLLALIVLFSLISKGFCDKCELGNIEIGTTRSGKEVAGKPEWNVVVKNNCQCTQSLIAVSCQGFQSSYPVDEKKLLKHGDKCIINRGDPLPGFATVSLSYAWDPPFILNWCLCPPLSSLVKSRSYPIVRVFGISVIFGIRLVPSRHMKM